MRHGPLVAVLGVLPLLASYGACSDGDGASKAPDDGGAVADATRERVGVDVEEADTGPPQPVYNADGWLRLDFDPGYNCGFYAALTPDKMPPPIAWEPCSGALPSGLVCRQIKTDWPPPNGGGWQYRMASVGSAWVDTAGGRVLIAANRFTGDSVFRIVAEADGPVHVAIVEARGSCSLGSEVSVRDGHVVYTAGRDESRPSGSVALRYGAIGGGLDEVPRVLRSIGDGVGRDYYAGANAFFEWGGGLTLRSWTDGGQIAALSLTDPGDPGGPRFQGDALHFQLADLDYARIKVYTPSGGLKDLVSYGNDVSHDAADFGTNGVDMAWVEGIGRSAGGIGKPFAAYDIMTAPYTTDAASVQKRRLRSEAGGLFRNAPFIVGCGYAAHEFYDATADSSIQQGTRIVRLTDGRSWKLLTVAVRPWVTPVAITCSEIFVNTFAVGSGAMDGGALAGPNLARVRLDSLGPGDPPD